MPTRLIRDGIISSPGINSLSLGAEVLYRRLMSVADDYGRFYASPLTIIGACWPTTPDKVTTDQITEWLAECEKPLPGEDAGLLVVYQSGPSRFLEIQKFGQRTRIKSKFPPMPPHSAAENSKPGLCTSHVCENPPQKKADVASTQTELAALFGGVFVVEDGGVLPTKPFSKTEDPNDLLERLYSAHPKKGDRGLAENYLASAIIGGVSAEKIEQTHKLCCELEPSYTDQGGKFAPTLAKWLLDRGYNYPPKTSPTAIPAKPQRGLQSPYNDPMFCALNELEDRIKAEDAAKAAANGKN